MIKWPGPSSLILLFAVLLMFGIFVISEPIPKTKTIENKAAPNHDTVPIEPASTKFEVAISHKFDELIAKAQSDIEQILGYKIRIIVFVGPYFRYLGFVAFLNTYYQPYYGLSLDDEFLEELTEAEINAVILHELGHILHRSPPNPNRNQSTEAEVLADSFMGKYPEYSSPKDMISLLDKAHSDYLIRRRRLEHLEKLAQGQ